MVKRNKNISKLKSGYLFPEINRRRNKFLKENPDAKLISLGIGNTTEPLTPYITQTLKEASEGMGNLQGYSGYGDEQGFAELRERIAHTAYNDLIEADEVFVSDGAKCDIGRIQLLFGSDVKIAVQDPSYPVYVDGSVIIGATQEYDDSKKQFNGIEYMSCTPENEFFPDLDSVGDVDVIYFCSPNNPTGATASKSQLKQLVDFAFDKEAIIVFDSAYCEYITESGKPKSIFEIEGAKEVSMEVNSFSKSVGFTGLRLGWTACPTDVKYGDGTAVHPDLNRIMCTVFNGASNVVQKAGLAALDDFGLKEMRDTVAFYMENAKIIKAGLDSIGIENYGGDNAPYIWARFGKRNSWEVFDEILEKTNVITTPGSGFGPAGEGFVRFSAFGHREDINEAVERLKKRLE